ncbi:hypothetical protein KFE25_010271 [Diacronema lutheri]|uniref:Uncharacterized protein n=1 Tax=Diacronema lutheri TaxID=2081491 RepID=A0A8J5X6X7_DIALT|nr:hypothetical protein KFE25_010271 [Diacronema lutheri]
MAAGTYEATCDATYDPRQLDDHRELAYPHVLVVIAGGEGAEHVAQRLAHAFRASGRAALMVEIAGLDAQLDAQLAMVVVVAQCDADGLSPPTRKWMRHGRAELLAARRVDVITVALSACHNSAASLKPCGLGASAKLGVRLRAGGAAVDECALYVDVGVDTNVDEALRDYVRMLALGWPVGHGSAPGSPEADGRAEGHDVARGVCAGNGSGTRERSGSERRQPQGAPLGTSRVLVLCITVPSVAAVLALTAVVARRLAGRLRPS